MKTGDLVTWKQREDLRESPCPWRRMGTVVGIDPLSEELEVYWYSAENIVSWATEDLELVNA